MLLISYPHCGKFCFAGPKHVKLLFRGLHSETARTNKVHLSSRFIRRVDLFIFLSFFSLWRNFYVIMHRLQYSWKRDTHDSLHYAEFISEIWTLRETVARDPNTRLRTTQTHRVKQSCVLVIYNAFKNKSLTNATGFSVRLGLKRNDREIKFRLGEGREREEKNKARQSDAISTRLAKTCADGKAMDGKGIKQILSEVRFYRNEG